MRYFSLTGQRAIPTARIAHVVRHLHPTRPRFRVNSTVAPRECGIGQFEAADAIAGIFFGDSFVKAVHESYGLGTALELYALWSVGYINDPDEAFGGFDT